MNGGNKTGNKKEEERKGMSKRAEREEIGKHGRAGRVKA